MKKRVLIFLMITAVVTSLSILPVDTTEAQSDSPVETIELSEGASTEKVAWDGSELWYLGGDPTDPGFVLREVAPSNGTVISDVNLNEEQTSSTPTGLVASNDSVWLLNGRDFETNGEVYRINASSGLTENTIQAPVTNPHGLAYDGETFWTFNSENNTLQSFDPETGEPMQTIEIPSATLSRGADLTWGSGFLWGTFGDEVFQIDVSGGTANIVNTHSIPISTPGGLAWDGQYFWIGDSSNSLSRVEIGPIGQPNTPPNASFDYSPQSPDAEQNVTFNASGSNDSNGYIQTYSWDFTGDGVADARGEQVNYTFSRADNFTVRLNVTDNAGYSNSTTRNLTVVERTPTSTQTSTPTSTATATETTTTTTTTSSADQQGVRNTSTPTDGGDGGGGGSSVFGPGFSIIAAIAALLMAGAARLRKEA